MTTSVDDWTQFNRDAGVKVGMKDAGGRIITLAHMRQEPLFSLADGRDEGLVQLMLSTTDTSIRDKVKMTANLIEESTEKLQSTSRLLINVSQVLGKDSKALADTLKLNASQVKDYTERLNTSLAKFGAVVNSDKLRKDVENVERLVTALERLAELDADGKLSKLMEALRHA